MAEAWTNTLRGDRVQALSAGVVPHGLDPQAVRVMAEVGVDMRDYRSKNVDDVLPAEFDCVVTLSERARTQLPASLDARRVLHVSFDAPSKSPLEASLTDELDAYRRVRDEIRAFVETLS